MRKLIGFMVLLPGLALGQTKPIMTHGEFQDLVMAHHPISQQARLITERGERVVTQARGSFDPKIVSSFDTKTYDGKDYFQLWDTYVNFPTILNFDLKAGYERNTGQYLNPENTVPTDGLYYAGVSVPLGRGLIHNQRTIDLKKSELGRQALQNEAGSVFNNLLLDANFTYWNWYESYMYLQLVRRNLALIDERFEGIRQGVLNGENAAMDSVESKIQWQKWSNDLRKAQVEYQNAVLKMQNFLWAIEVNSGDLRPDFVLGPTSLNMENTVDFAIKNNPDLLALKIQAMDLELDRKMSAELVKPEFNVNYNVLLQNGSEETSNPGLSNNYKAGFNFSFPILMRKDRAKLQQVKIKIDETDLKINQKSTELINKIEQLYAKAETLEAMVAQQQEMLLGYDMLLQGEKSKFENGESSVFLVNSRENKKIDAEIKLIQLKADYAKTIGLLQWTTGVHTQELIVP